MKKYHLLSLEMYYIYSTDKENLTNLATTIKNDLPYVKVEIEPSTKNGPLAFRIEEHGWWDIMAILCKDGWEPIGVGHGQSRMETQYLFRREYDSV